MTNLFYDSFQNANNWLSGNNQASTMTIVADPKGIYQNAIKFASVTDRPDTFSTLIRNNYKSFTLNFDYLGLPLNQQTVFNLGCVLSISDGGSLIDLTVAYAGSVKNAYPPISPNYLCQRSAGYSNCETNGIRYYRKLSSFNFLTDDSEWHHYSISFTTTSDYIRVAMADFSYANPPESNNPGDCYVANLLVTDSYGPSAFVATSTPENFRSISVDVLNQVADTVSYIESNAAVNINLGSKSASGGYATGDVLNDITNVIGSNYNDIILGNSGNNILTGGDGNDSLTAGSGNDILIGGNGSDKFVITTEITSATIRDFEVGNDIIDLRLFNNLYSFQAIKAVSMYTNGNTVINLGDSKVLTLSGINYNDLSDNSFIISTLSPTIAPSTTPTTSPSQIPTNFPTAFPTKTPSIMPSAPTFVPSLYPTTLPSATPTKNPTLSPTFLPTLTPTIFPSLEPTKAPTLIPTAIPSLMPTIFPTNDPTVSPSALFSNNINIMGGGSFSGTSGSDNFILNSALDVSIRGNGGEDRFTIFPHQGVMYTIVDFDSTIERIDITNSGITSFEEIDISASTPVAITLLNNQKIKLIGLNADNLAYGNFIFATPLPTVSPTSSPQKSSILDIAIIVGMAVGGPIFGAASILLIRKNFLSQGKSAILPQEELSKKNLDYSVALQDELHSDINQACSNNEQSSIPADYCIHLEEKESIKDEENQNKANSHVTIPKKSCVVCSIDAMMDPQHVRLQNEEFARFGRHLTNAYQDIAKLVSEQFSSSQSLLKNDVMPTKGANPLPETNFISTDLSVSFQRIQNGLELFPLVKYISSNIVYPLFENYIPESLQNITLPEISNTMLVTAHMSIGHLYAWQQPQGNVPFYIVESVAKSGSFAARLGVTKYINDYRDELEQNEQSITTSEAIKHCVSTILTYTVPDLLICAVAKTAMPSYECGDLNLGAKLSFAGSECYWDYKASQEPTTPTNADVMVPYIADIAAGITAYTNGYGLMGAVTSVVAADWMSKAVMDYTHE